MDSSSKSAPLLDASPAASSDTSYSTLTSDESVTPKSLLHFPRHMRVVVTASLIIFTIAFCAGLGIYLLIARIDPETPPPPNPEPQPPLHVNCDPSLTPAGCLRLYLAAYSLTAYIVPSNDAHNSEYVADCDKRRQFISNFTGSAGTALVVNLPGQLNRMYTDSRYELQVASELDPKEWWWTAGGGGGGSYQTWAIANLPKGSTIGIDPSLITAAAFATQSGTYAAAGLTLVAVQQNLVDLVWGAARPAASMAPMFVLPLNVTGETVASKLARVRVTFAAQRCVAMVVTALDDIGWMTNMRGRDIENTPVFTSYLVITATALSVYVEPNKTVNVVQYAQENGITLRPYTSLVADLVELNKTLSASARVWVSGINQAIAGSFAPAVMYSATTPIVSMKAQKNAVEIASMTHAHKKDSAAFAVFFDWLEQQMAAGTYIDECSAADQIERIRAQMPGFVELSYPTIAGSGPNGAIVHYFPQPPTCASVTTSKMFLVDSGGQWLDCSTTDTTRTIHMGNATFFERHAFTRVLQGHIDQMTIVWPNGNTPTDWAARQPLLRDGLTYGHGTSHGVGEMLNVHESLGSSYVGGIITSVEPGYYHLTNNNTALDRLYPGYKNGFGVRIETDAVVVPHITPLNNVTRFWTYEPIAFVPLQTSLMRSSIMSDVQIEWVNNYNRRCVEEVRPYLMGFPASALRWLERQAIPLVKRRDD